jgi:multiple sugar transport system permease protein
MGAASTDRLDETTEERMLSRPWHALLTRPRVGSALIYVILGFASLAFVVPFLLMLSNAFKSPAEIARIPPTLVPEDPSTNSFEYVLTNAPYLTWYKNSLIVAVTVTVLVLLTSSLAGYVFAKFDFRGKTVAFVVVLSTLIVPFPVLLVPQYLIADHLHLLNTLWALILPYLASAFGVFLMRQFMGGIPSELIEAARMDGAPEGSIFLRVILPMSKAPLAALGIFTFLFIWNDYLWPLVAIDDLDKSTLPLALGFFDTGRGANRYDLTMAAAAMAVIPVIIVFLIFQRRITKAFVLGGMK